MDATMLFDVPANPKHPARYTKSLLPVMAGMLKGRRRILDPFGGVGGAFALEAWLPGATVNCVEIEPAWAACHPRTTLGSALALPWPDNYFDAICTSPTYGNRMADTLLDGYDRITYTSKLAVSCTLTTQGACSGATSTAPSTSRPGRNHAACCALARRSC